MAKSPQKAQYSNQDIVWIISDEQSSSSGAHPRSYTCTFCNRGFSNAQALGGHMNIHRRDRAKLRESAEETLLSSEIASTNPCPIELSSIASEEKDILILESSDDKSCISDRTSRISFIKEYDGDSRGRNVVGEDSGKVNPVELHQESSSCMKERSKIYHQQLAFDAPEIELDLELRLGPEPSKNSSPRSIN